MYGILDEDQTDAETLKSIVVRVVGRDVKVKTQGFGGKDKLLGKGSATIQLYRLAMVERKCSSFRPLASFLRQT